MHSAALLAEDLSRDRNAAWSLEKWVCAWADKMGRYISEAAPCHSPSRKGSSMGSLATPQSARLSTVPLSARSTPEHSIGGQGGLESWRTRRMHQPPPSARGARNQRQHDDGRISVPLGGNQTSQPPPDAQIAVAALNAVERAVRPFLQAASSRSSQTQSDGWNALVSPRCSQPGSGLKPWQYGMQGLSPSASGGLGGKPGTPAATPRSMNFPTLNLSASDRRPGRHLGERGSLSSLHTPGSLQVQREAPAATPSERRSGSSSSSCSSSRSCSPIQGKENGQGKGPHTEESVTEPKVGAMKAIGGAGLGVGGRKFPMPPLSLTSLQRQGQNESFPSNTLSTQEGGMDLAKASSASSTASSDVSTESCRTDHDEHHKAEALPALPALPNVELHAPRSTSDAVPIQGLGDAQGSQSTKSGIVQMRVDRIAGLIDKVQLCIERQRAVAIAIAKDPDLGATQPWCQANAGAKY
mmetsp:Transcript_66827/g.159942  ORF Transcript_66827/g.159942 Transcript_66827/m.159942 type:complete len:469 (-) Transcript_66827:104-1510(-)